MCRGRSHRWRSVLANGAEAAAQRLVESCSSCSQFLHNFPFGVSKHQIKQIRKSSGFGSAQRRGAGEGAELHDGLDAVVFTRESTGPRHLKLAKSQTFGDTLTYLQQLFKLKTGCCSSLPGRQQQPGPRPTRGETKLQVGLAALHESPTAPICFL